MSSKPLRFTIALSSLAVLAVSSEPTVPRPGPLLRLTHDGLDKLRPSWAPDGRTILYARRERDGLQVWQYLQDVTGPSSQPRRLTDRKAPEYDGTFSPDGKKVL